MPLLSVLLSVLTLLLLVLFLVLLVGIIIRIVIGNVMLVISIVIIIINSFLQLLLSLLFWKWGQYVCGYAHLRAGATSGFVPCAVLWGSSIRVARGGPAEVCVGYVSMIQDAGVRVQRFL